MQVVSKYPEGVFSWVDLSSTDIEAARAFYTGLFGWDATDLDDGQGNYIYTMFTIDGHNVAGMGKMQPDMASQGIPTHWSSYINHSDVDSIVAKATEAGGHVMFPPMDVMDSGRMTMIQDPQGAIVGVWQPRSHIGAQLCNIPNTLVWNELQTTDLEGAQGFYGAVFGWTGQADERNYVAYSSEGGRVHAGMMAIDPSWGEVPPNWSTYFMVEDVDATVATAQELGGNVLVPAVEMAEFAKFCVLQDPTGGVFTVIKFYGQVDAPPGY